MNELRLPIPKKYNRKGRKENFAPFAASAVKACSVLTAVASLPNCLGKRLQNLFQQLFPLLNIRNLLRAGDFTFNRQRAVEAESF